MGTCTMYLKQDGCTLILRNIRLITDKHYNYFNDYMIYTGKTNNIDKGSV